MGANLVLTSSSISVTVAKSSGVKSSLDLISSIIVKALFGESACTKTESKYNFI